MRRANGFTLIELMIAVAIVAIITAVALPAYRDYVIRGKLADAYNTLASQRVKMEQFYQDNRTYNNGAVAACVAGTVAPPPNSVYFTYVCATADQTYTITATGNPVQGVPNTFQFSIDQSNNQLTVSVAPGWVLPAPNNCWVRTKGGQC